MIGTVGVLLPVLAWFALADQSLDAKLDGHGHPVIEERLKNIEQSLAKQEATIDNVLVPGLYKLLASAGID